MGLFSQAHVNDGPAPQTGRRFWSALVLGVLVTAIVVAVTATGGLNRAEQALLNKRMQWFGQFTPPPSSRIIHIDIDDNALKSIGRWPWPRSRMADVVNELDRLGARIIALDVLYDEPQEPRIVEQPDSESARYVKQDDDRIFADAIRRSGKVILAMNATSRLKIPDSVAPAVDLLQDNLLLNADALAGELGLDGDDRRWLEANLRQLKRQAIYGELAAHLQTQDQTPDQDTVKQALFPELKENPREAELHLLEQEYARAAAMHRHRHDWPPAYRADDDLIIHPSVPALDEAAMGRGMVVFDYDADGTARSVPLWIAAEGKLLPHFSLEIVARYLGYDLNLAEPAADRTVLPGFPIKVGEGKPLIIDTLQARAGEAGWTYPHNRVIVPWQSTAERWEHLFDPNQAAPKQHLPIGPLVELADQRQVLRDSRIANHQLWQWVTDPNLQLFLELDPALAERYTQIKAALIDGDADAPERATAFAAQMLEYVQEDPTFEAFVGELNAIPADDLGPAERQLKEALANLPARHAANQRIIDAGQAQITAAEAHYRPVNGAICLIGWTATASIADFVPTALHAKAPGVTTHGALINAILTDHLLTRGPFWLDLLLTAMLGLIAAAIAASFAPIRTLVMTGGLIACYFLANGMLAFDYGDTIVAAAAPMTAAAAAWLAITVYRLFTEQRERARITKQFKNYVSADLVESLVTNPVAIKYGRHELTCMFSDIAGFTTISEQLGTEQTARLLNRALSSATELLMQQRGYVNKYLGDGIMCVFGAPLDNNQHAIDCCASALACVHSIDSIRDDPEYRDLPELFMRVGISTGPMMVGDFGAPPLRSDYTVIGDAVNLAARLESANKQFGTQIIISQRTAEIVEQEMLMRPIGRIVVVGKQAPEEVFELLSTKIAATRSQRRLAEHTTRAVELFYTGDFAACIEAWQQLRREHGDQKLIELYINTCRQYLEQGAPDDFNGSITLTTK